MAARRQRPAIGRQTASGGVSRTTSPRAGGRDGVGGAGAGGWQSIAAVTHHNAFVSLGAGLLFYNLMLFANVWCGRAALAHGTRADGG